MQAILQEEHGAPPSSQEDKPSSFAVFRHSLGTKWQQMIDDTAIYIKSRWFFLAFLVFAYCVRIYIVEGFHIITYALGIFLLNLFIGFLTPLGDPEKTPLPMSSADEYKPFEPRLPEFKFWYACVKAVALAFFATFFPFLNLPVFWPILLIYFVVLFVVTMKNQIQHMIKYQYCPCACGRKKAYSKQAEDVRTK